MYEYMYCTLSHSTLPKVSHGAARGGPPAGAEAACMGIIINYY